jgi:class 3 adenylate cyclase
LLQFDVLARGGLAAGGAFHTEEFVFGTSVNHARELEKQARWPLTLLSSEVLEDAKTYGQLFLDLFQPIPWEDPSSTT